MPFAGLRVRQFVIVHYAHHARFLPSLISHGSTIAHLLHLLSPRQLHPRCLSRSTRRNGRSQTISHLMITLLAEHALRLNQIGLHASHIQTTITSIRLGHSRRLRTPGPHLLHHIRLRLNITHLPTLPARPRFDIRLKILHRLLNLRPQIRTMETLLVHLAPAVLAIPPQAIHTVLRPGLLNYHANRIRKPHWIMRDVARQQEQLALVDVDVAELAGGGLDGLEKHAAGVLVEELRGGVDVVVGAGVGAADDHDCEGVVVDQVVVDGRFEEVRVCLEPVGEAIRKGLDERFLG